MKIMNSPRFMVFNVSVLARKTHPEFPQLRPLSDKSNLENFSLEDGSRLVLNQQNNNAKFLRLAPAMLVTKKEESAPFLVSGLSFTGGKIIPHNSKSLNFRDHAKIDEILGSFIKYDTSNDEFLL